jgi:hypothetical protein
MVISSLGKLSLTGTILHSRSLGVLVEPITTALNGLAKLPETPSTPTYEVNVIFELSILNPSTLQKLVTKDLV